MLEEVERKRVELTLKREDIPVNDDTIRAFETAMKMKVLAIISQATRPHYTSRDIFDKERF